LESFFSYSFCSRKYKEFLLLCFFKLTFRVTLLWLQKHLGIIFLLHHLSWYYLHLWWTTNPATLLCSTILHTNLSTAQKNIFPHICIVHTVQSVHWYDAWIIMFALNILHPCKPSTNTANKNVSKPGTVHHEFVNLPWLQGTLLRTFKFPLKSIKTTYDLSLLVDECQTHKCEWQVLCYPETFVCMIINFDA